MPARSTLPRYSKPRPSASSPLFTSSKYARSAGPSQPAASRRTASGPRRSASRRRAPAATCRPFSGQMRARKPMRNGPGPRAASGGGPCPSSRRPRGTTWKRSRGTSRYPAMESAYAALGDRNPSTSEARLRSSSRACERQGSTSRSRKISSPCTPHRTGRPRARFRGPARPASMLLVSCTRSGRRSFASHRHSSSSCRRWRPSSPRRTERVRAPRSRASVAPPKRSAAQRSRPGRSRGRVTQDGRRRTRADFCSR